MTAQLPSRNTLQKIIETANEIITVNNGTNEDISKNDTNKIIGLYDYLNDDLASPSVVKALAEFALAAHEQEPVAWQWQNHGQWHVTNDEERARDLAWDGVEVLPLYTHPAPVPAVPDEWRSSLQELVKAMRDYEMYVDEPAPYKHREMMRRAEALLNGCKS